MTKATKVIIAVLIASALLVSLIYVLGPSQEPETPQPPSSSEGLAGDRILFATFKAGEGLFESLYLLDVGSTQVTKLIDLNAPGDPGWPPFSLSQDGERVAYFSSDGYLSIFNLNDKSITKVVEAQQEEGDEYAAWSPDESQITYVCGRRLYIVNADGTDEKELAFSKSGLYVPEGGIADQIRHPVWSADGERILFDDFHVPSEMYGGPRQADYRTVYAVNIDSGEKTEVFKRAVIESPTSYSAELMVYGYSEGTSPTLLIVGDDGTMRKELPGLSDARYFRRSPDGGIIAYLTTAFDEGIHSELKMVDATTGEEIPLKARLSADALIWSPDSQHIAYVKTGLEITDEIHIVRRDSSHDSFIYHLPEPPEAEYASRSIVLIAWLK
jgi:Tol biopolymer transport system component